MSPIVINPYAFGKSYNRIPLKMLKAVPAGFPLAIHDDYFDAVGHSNAIFSNIQSTGEDLRAFTDLAMTNEIPIEVVEVTTGSNLLKAFVRVPSALAINDKIYLRTTVGGGETANAVTATNGRNNVWQDYNLVRHGNDLTVDVTGNNADGTNTGGVTKSGGDLLNGWPAIGFGVNEGTASTDRSTSPTPTDSEVCTESVVFLKNATEGSTSGRIAQWSGIGYDLFKMPTDEFHWRRATSGTSQSVASTNGELTASAWHHVGVIWSAISSAPTLRFDGAALTSPTIVNGTGTYTSPSSDHILGNSGNLGAPSDCRIAEFRHRPDNTPDAAWLDLEWDCFNNPGGVAEAEALVVV